MSASIERMIEAKNEPDRQELLAQLKRRCDEAKIECTIRTLPSGKTAVEVRLRNGRNLRSFTFHETYALKALLDSSFEKLTLLGDYIATCSYENGVIEAAVRPLHPFPFIRARLLKPSADGSGEERPVEVKSASGASLIIGPASATIHLLYEAVQPGVSPLCVRIRGVKLRNHDHALEILENLSNAFFLQIELLFGTHLGLVRHRQPWRPVAGRSNSDLIQDLSFPKVQYDRAPLSLYSYARSAFGMPLLQFLAYYQAVEFYFPTYSQAEARRRIRGILNSPTFRPDRDAEIGRILATVMGGSSGLGDERAQLRATVNECIDASKLREFLCQTEDRRDFFANRKSSIAKRFLPLKSPDIAHLDLRNEVAERVYEIRCRIVHTKSGSGEPEAELLLPFSPESEALSHDIELVQFIAREVIIAAGSPLTIEPFDSDGSNAGDPG